MEADKAMHATNFSACNGQGYHQTTKGSNLEHGDLMWTRGRNYVFFWLTAERRGGQL